MAYLWHEITGKQNAALFTRTGEDKGDTSFVTCTLN